MTDTAHVETTTNAESEDAATAEGQSTAVLLDAGAVIPLPGDGSVKPGDREDVLLTRAYQHPAMDGRTVVRLVPSALGDAEDLTMEFLGFRRPDADGVAEVGIVLRKSLGFPAWALVNDPANGHHALALVKEIERLGRQAKSKPGNARDGFDALGKRLAASVPHFLPSFYEQAGRAFLAAENKTYASSMFTKARESERAHGLPIDEDLQAAAFLEFALNGALPAKAVGEYAKALAVRNAPADAFRRFRLLVLERTSGGLPPYSGLAADMKRLAKAAELDVVAEELSLLREMLDAPAIVRAPKAFWTSYSSTLIKLAKEEPAVRGKLLALNPALSGAKNDEGDRFWLGVLADSGALEALTAPADSESVPLAARCPDGAAGWLNRFVKNRTRSWGWYREPVRMPELLDLVTRMAPRLRAEGTALDVAGRRVDVDLIDLCLDLGLTVAEPGHGHWQFDLSDWLQEMDVPGRRDLSAFAEHAYFGPVLVRSLGRLSGSYDNGKKHLGAIAVRFDEFAHIPGLRVALTRWLEERGEDVVASGLPSMEAALRALRCVAVPKVFAVNRAPVERVAAFDVAPALAESLRAGILDEFSWPALEEACAELVGGDRHQPPSGDVEIIEQWPYLVVRKKQRIAVVGNDGTVLEHTSSVPTNPSPWNTSYRYADGQLLVQWNGYQNSGAYWTGDPTRAIEWEQTGYLNFGFGSMEVAGHGRSCGGRPLRAGDTTVEESASVISDGKTYWRLEPGIDAAWQEFDPATGAVGRASLPSFFEDGLASGESLVRPASRVRPVVPGTENSPLGTANGLLGWRVRSHPDASKTGDGADGRSFRLPMAGRDLNYDQPAGLVWFPGAEAPTPMVAIGSRAYGQPELLAFVTADGRDLTRIRPGEHGHKYARGTWCVPPLWFWNFLVPRDEAGSRFLRALDVTQARALMEAARDLKRPEAAKAIAALLPEVTHPQLVLGITGYVREALSREADIAKIRNAAARDPETDSSEADHLTDPRLKLPAWDNALTDAVEGLVQLSGFYGPPPPSVGECVAWLTDTFHGRDTSGRRLDREKVMQVGWLFANLPALMFRAASPATSENRRRTLTQIVDAVAASGLLRDGWSVRSVRMIALQEGEKLKPGTVIPTERGRVILLHEWTVWHDGAQVRRLSGMQFTEGASFDDVPGWTLDEETRIPTWADGALERIADLLRSGPIAWDPANATRFGEAVGLTYAEAALAVAGMPGVAPYRSKVDTETRKLLDLKPAQASAAVSRYERMQVPTRAQVLAALAGDDPARLWERGPDVDGAVAWWEKTFGKKVQIPESLLTEAHAALKPQHYWSQTMPVADLLQGIAGVDTWPLLQEPVADASGFSAATISSLMKTLVWLAYRLPYGDPLRAALPTAVRLLRARVTDPAVQLDVGYTGDLAKLEAPLGLTRLESGDEVRLGPFRVAARSAEWFMVRLVPGDLTGADDPALDAAATLDNGTGFPLLRAILDGTLESLVAVPQAGGSGSEGGGAGDGATFQAQDPTRSVPHLVEEAAARLGLSQDAAALYLMLLALPDPTDRNTAAWTGWKPARMKAARAELGATSLVVEGTRPRAGRSMFLPCGWQELKAPALPVEAWKARWLGMSGQGVPLLTITSPWLPVPALFAAAWQRVLDGDEPRLEELKTGRRR